MALKTAATTKSLPSYSQCCPVHTSMVAFSTLHSDSLLHGYHHYQTLSITREGKKIVLQARAVPGIRLGSLFDCLVHQ